MSRTVEDAGPYSFVNILMRRSVKILSFFKGAIKDYAGDEGLTREARKFYRSFKKRTVGLFLIESLSTSKKKITEISCIASTQKKRKSPPPSRLYMLL